MKKYHVRDLLDVSQEDLWDTSRYPDDECEVVFEDGITLQLHMREVIVSSYFWLIQRDWIEIPVNSNHIIRIEDWNVDSPGVLMDKVLKTIEHVANWIDKEYLMLKIVEMINNFHNDMIERTQEYIVSVNGFDLTEYCESPEIKSIVERLRPTHASILGAYKESDELAVNREWLFFNPMKRAVRFGVLNLQQFKQVTVARGFVTDVDNEQFDHPILNGYARGFHSLHDFSIETRSAAKAAIQQKSPIANTEYFARKSQITNETIRFLYPGDCGTDKYVSFRINGTNFKSSIGTSYLDPDDNQVKPIREEDKEKILGLKVIRIRTAIGCKHLSKYGVCEACLGEIHHNIPKKISIGHVSAIVINKEMAQKILSFKHLDKSEEIKPFRLEKHEEKYFEVCGAEKNMVKLATKINRKYRYQLIIDSDSLHGLADVNIAEDGTELSYSRISEVSQVGLIIEDDKGNQTYEVIVVSDTSRNSFFTSKFLDYILSFKVLEREGRKNLKVPLDLWDFNEPMLEFPLRRESMQDYLDEFSKIIETEISKLKVDINTEEGISDAVALTYNTVSKFVNVPISYVAMWLAAELTRDSDETDARLPLFDGKREFSSRQKLYGTRSLSAVMALQSQTKVLISPYAVTNKLRANHPFDSFLDYRAGDIWVDYEDKNVLP